MQTVSRKEFLGSTLEAAFFSQMDNDLISEFNRKLTLSEKLEAFRNATGIRDRKHLIALIHAGFEVSTLTAFTWVPFVFVAWADGQIDESERDTIFETLIARGIAPEIVERMIEHEWFHKRPTHELWRIWREFAMEALSQQSIALRNELMDDLVTLCHLVAIASSEKSGTERVTDKEWKVIDRVAETMCAVSAAT
jgi:hypothetical protein